MKKEIRESTRQNLRRVVIAGESFTADQVCTFQVHSRKRVNRLLKSIRSKSITVENVSIEDGMKIVRLGIEQFKAGRQ